MCHSQTAKPRSWFPTSWNAPVPWRYLAIRMETGTVCNSRAGMDKAWNQMACVILWQFRLKCVHHFKLHDSWSSSMAPKIRQQGFTCHAKCLGCQCSVTLRCIIPACQGTIFWQSVKWCRKYWGIVSWVNPNLTNIGSFKWSHWTQSFIESRHEKRPHFALTAGFVVCWPPARGCCRCSWLVCPQRARGRKAQRIQGFKGSNISRSWDHEICSFWKFKMKWWWYTESISQH